MSDPTRHAYGEELPDVPRKDPSEEPGILSKPDKIKRLMQLLFGAAVVVMLIDLVYTPHFHVDEIESGFGKGFYGVYGFLGLVVLVLGAKLLRQLVMRPENYYDRAEREDGGSDE